MRIKPIIIISGQPKSIFFEIFLKSLKFKKYRTPLIIIGSLYLLKDQIKKSNYKKDINLLKINEIKKKKLNNNSINIIDIKLKKTSNHKLKEKYSNTYIHNCFSTAFKLIKQGIAYKLINGPINKTKFLNKKFLGITEFISNEFNKKKFAMLIYNEKLSVCPLTTHLPLKLVARNISKKKIIEKVEIIENFYKKNFNIKPKIGVTGLNPHCESILKFNEDIKIIAPAIKFLKKRKINVNGPIPADTIFLKKNRKKYDVILGMYHDQVLTPIKTLLEQDAINITMGLPFLRVTPDHGPNEKMYKKNKSSPLSLIKAINFLDKK